MLLETVAGTDVGMPMTLINVVGDTATPGNSYINEYSALTVPGFWSGVRFLAETMASFRRSIHQELPGSRVIATAHPLNYLMRRKVSRISSPYRTFETWVHHAVVWGNGYLLVDRDSRGAPVGLLNLNPDLVAPFVYDGQKYFFYKGTKELVFNDDDVLHISGIGFDGIRGYPMVQLMRYAIETPKLAEMFTKDYLDRGTFMSGAITSDRVLTKEQMETLKASVRAYSTPQGRKRFQMMILDDSKKLVNSTIPNQTSQLIETRKFSDIVICQILRISPHVIYQLDSQKLANVQQMGAEVVKYSLTPWATKIEDEINSKLFSTADQDAGFYFKLNMDSLLRGDAATLSTMMLAEVNAGTRTVNEYRMEMGLDPIGPAGDVLRVPVNFPNAGQPASQPGGSGVDAPIEDDQEKIDEPPADPAVPSGISQPPGTGPGNPEPGPASYSILKPIIDAAANRVEVKSTKAFTSRIGKDSPEKLLIWGNAFAGEQAAYVREAFTPIAAAAKDLKGSIDVEKLASRYELEIKRRASGHAAKTLSNIYTELSNGQ